MELINNIDMFFINTALDMRNSTLSFFLSIITTVADSGICWIILGVVLLLFRRTRKTGFFVLVCLLFTWLLNESVKNMICRPRPYDTYPWITTVIPPLSSYSFPSGHASSSFAAATAIFLFNKKAGIWTYFASFLVAISRIYFCVHYFTDVIAGAAEGVLMTVMIIRLIYPAINKKYRSNLYKSDKEYTVGEGFCAFPITSDIFARINGRSYRPNDKITIDMLHYLKLRYIGFDGLEHEGEMIVNRIISKKTLRIFKRLYDKGYKIEKIRLIDEYGADDEKSMTDNNSSAFCFRTIANTETLSNHALGLAIDINPLYNPYIQNGRVLPAAAEKYADRNADFPHKITKNDYAVKIFKSYGFVWGGDWQNGSKDYQHFDIKV